MQSATILPRGKTFSKAAQCRQMMFIFSAKAVQAQNCKRKRPARFDLCQYKFALGGQAAGCARLQLMLVRLRSVILIRTSTPGSRNNSVTTSV